MSSSTRGDAPVLGEGCEPLISRQGAPLRYLLLRRASRTCAATSCIWRRRRWRADHQSNRFDTGFFFRVTLKRHEIVEHTHVIHEQRKLPLVLSVEEVARLLEPATAEGHHASNVQLPPTCRQERNGTSGRIASSIADRQLPRASHRPARIY
jgi:hypothetical protein